MKQKTYWWARDNTTHTLIYGDCYNYNLFWGRKPSLQQDGVWYGNTLMDPFCPEDVERVCPSAKLEPGECVEITGFKIIKKKRGIV